VLVGAGFVLQHLRHAEPGFDVLDADARPFAHLAIRHQHYEVLDVSDTVALVADVLDVHDVLLSFLDRNGRVSFSHTPEFSARRKEPWGRAFV